jgi:hypothetical protein
MHAAVPTAPDRAPRRARYLIPRDTPRRAEVLAALTIAALLASLLLAALTVMLAAALHTVSKLSRWRPAWLAAPAAGGVIWALAAGPAAALAGFGAEPAAVASVLSRVAADPATVGRLALLPTVIGRGLAGEFPVAFILAPGLAAVAWWLDRLHTNEWDMPVPRPGLASLCHRKLTAAFVRSGRMVTREGVCLGPDRVTGRPVNLSWREAGGGVLVTGGSWDAVSRSSLQLVHAAIRRRTPVIVVDLAAGAGLRSAITTICAAADAPLQVFSAGGHGRYDPFRAHDPEDAADLVMAMIGQDQVAESARPAARACLAAVFAAMSAWPAELPGAALDDVVSMLRAGACRAAIERVPGYQPGFPALADSLQAAARWLETDQAAASAIAQQLRMLRGSALGRWLIPVPQESASEPATGISVCEVIRQRAVALFALDQASNGRAARMVGDLVAREIALVWAGLCRDGTAGDGLVCFCPCDGVDPGALRELIGLGGAADLGTGNGAGAAAGYGHGVHPGMPAVTGSRAAAGYGRRTSPRPAAGLVCVLATTSAEVASGLVERASARVVHRLADQQLAGRLAPLTGGRWVPAARAAALAEGPAPGQGGIGSGGIGSGGIRSGTMGPGSMDGGWAASPFGVIKAPVVAAESLCRLADGEFALIVGQGERVVARGQAVTGGILRRWGR